MAYVLGKKIVTDTADYENYAYGITLPVRRGKTGYFKQAFTSFEQAKANLKNLLLTKQGERIMQPEFGTGLDNLLFDQATTNLAEKLQETITNSVNYWLPYINIDEIVVEMTDEMKDKHTAGLTIKFTIGNDVNLQSLTFTIN